MKPWSNCILNEQDFTKYMYMHVLSVHLIVQSLIIQLFNCSSAVSIGWVASQIIKKLSRPMRLEYKHRSGEKFR